MVVITRREDHINLKINNNKIFMAISFGLACLLVPVLIILIDPIHTILNYNLRLKTGSALYNLLIQEMKGARLSIYVFNITNPDRFLSGEDPKLKVNEVGPFVYQEYRWFEDLEMNEDGTEMAMTSKIRSEFVPEASIGDPKNVTLTLGNLPMLGATSLLSNYPSFIRTMYSTIAAQINSKSIVHLDVHSYLWGYNNPLISLCHKITPGLVYFEKVGLLDRLYDNQSVYRIVTGATSQDRFKIKSVTKSTYLHHGSIDNVEVSEFKFNDTYEGLGYPPELTSDVPINLYRVPICKSLELEYIGRRTMYYGGEGLVYTVSNRTFHSELNPVTNKNYPEGLLDISKCYYGLPFVVSKSHFLDADPKLLDQVDGLKPDREKFVNEMVIDRRVGVTFDTRMSMQLSLVLNDLSFNFENRRFSNSVVPSIRVELKQSKMSDGLMMLFYLVYMIAPTILIIIEIILSVLGLVLLWKGVRSMYFNWLLGANGIILETAREKKILTETLSGVPLIGHVDKLTTDPVCESLGVLLATCSR